MDRLIYLLLFLISFLISCSQIGNTDFGMESELESKLDTLGITIETRFRVPENFERTKVEETSFSKYLRTLPLKPHGSSVTLFDGRTKTNYNVYDAVIDLPIGNKNLHQCADAVMRLKAEYLWNQKRYSEIHFKFTNGFRVDYAEWMKGKRVVIDGNKTYWAQNSNASNTYKDFWKYMELIFNYAGTLSLSQELKSVKLEDMEIGDVFIHGGSPGHAVIVVDMAINPTTNEKLFLLAQSYMPAQEIQLLKNLNNEKMSPWYSLNFTGDLNTPEWTFSQNELKRFVD